VLPPNSFAGVYNTKGENMGFAKNLTNLIKENNLSYKKVADGAGVNERAVSFWAQGKRVPSLVNAKKIADYFGLTLDEIAKESQEV